jgi:hypothetical protein
LRFRSALGSKRNNPCRDCHEKRDEKNRMTKNEAWMKVVEHDSVQKEVDDEGMKNMKNGVLIYYQYLALPRSKINLRNILTLVGCVLGGNIVIDHSWVANRLR